MPHLSDAQLHTLAVAAAYLIVEALRVFAPAVFARLPRQAQALPAIGLGALVHVLLGDAETAREMAQSGLLGLVDGLTAVGVHHTRKRLGVPPVSGAAVVCAGLVSCTPPPTLCAPETLDAIDAAYVAEATTACRDQPLDECRELPAIRERYARLRDAWESCQ